MTHALSGALLGRASASRKPERESLPLGRRIFVGLVAAAFPDVDVIASYLSPLSYLYHHRGVTHSLVMLPLWALLLALVFSALWRGKPRWRAYYGIAALGIGLHIAGDWITSYGTIVLAPLSDARYALSTTFIIDLTFSAIIIAGLLASLVWRSSRVPAVAGLTVLAAYVAFQWFLQQQAIDFGVAHARAHGLHGARVTAMPRPVSPFNWTVFIDHEDAYRYSHVNLVRNSARSEPPADANFFARLDAPYRPLKDAVWTRVHKYGGAPDEVALGREAFQQPAFEFYRWFAAYPARLEIDAAQRERCVWFHDLRFAVPGREPTLFRYGMCREDAGPWRPFQLIGAQRIAVY